MAPRQRLKRHHQPQPQTSQIRDARIPLECQAGTDRVGTGDSPVRCQVVIPNRHEGAVRNLFLVPRTKFVNPPLRSRSFICYKQ